MAASVDTAVLRVLRGITQVDIHDGDVTDADAETKTISAPLPYAVFHTTPGAPTSRRLTGPAGRDVEFLINSVGETREQATAAGDLVERTLLAAPIEVAPGRVRRIRRTEDNAFVRPDSTWTRLGGGPLFTDSRRYAVAAR